MYDSLRIISHNSVPWLIAKIAAIVHIHNIIPVIGVLSSEL